MKKVYIMLVFLLITSVFSKITIMDFGGDCMTCRMQKRILENLAKNYNKKKLFIKFINYKDHKNMKLVTKYKIYTVPTLIFIDDTGKMIYRNNGFYSKKLLLEKLKDLNLEVN